MLAVTQIMSGKDATRYYAGSEDDSHSHAEGKGIWIGKGAELLGLSGHVDPEHFYSLSINQNPITNQKLTVRTKLKRTSGYDWSFDVPKSVSIYLAETGDERVRRLIWESFRTVMENVEKKMETRVKSTHHRSTGNLICAAFEHRTTRPIGGLSDPQFHIHGFVFNATFDGEENRWKAAQFGRLKRDAPKYQESFNDALMIRLMHNGYQIRTTKHAFELKRISRELIEKFSKRAKIIGDAAREITDKIGIELSRIQKRLQRITREKKTKTDPGTIRDHWRSQMTDTDRQSIQSIQQESDFYNATDIEQEHTIDHEQRHASHTKEISLTRDVLPPTDGMDRTR